MTAPQAQCDYCGETAPVRLKDHDGYIHDELICEDCFSHDVAGWDDLPFPNFPREE